MENTNLDPRPVQEIEQELESMCSPDFQAFAPERAYRAAYLFGEISSAFEGAQGKVEILGSWTFEEWISKFQQIKGSKGRRSIFKYATVGQYLIGRIDRNEFKKLGIEKAGVLAAVAKAGRLSDDFLRASHGYTVQQLKEKAAPLLGRKVPWESGLEIDDHRAAQAALIVLGNKLGYETYTPDGGRSFQDKKLSEIATLRELPHFPSEQIDRSARTIDVVWVKDEWPDCFFEVEHTQNVKEALIRMFQVLKVDAKFFIVGPKPAHRKFVRAIDEAPFKKFKDKYRFRSYNELTNMFKAAVKYCDAHSRFFDQEE